MTANTPTTAIAVTVNVTDDFLTYVLCTAVEGGSNYWAAFKTLDRRTVEGSDIEWYSRVRVRDHESDTEPVIIGLGELHEGVRRVIAGDMNRKESHANCHPRYGAALLEAVVTDDAGNVDVELADLILQAAVFGHVVYG